ncbi:MAG TPA: ABC transporter substrate-binding protein [Chloroflexota bacterium]|nr:ABC transporter substrate-binding protein [Chloroflexota bacterium]
MSKVRITLACGDYDRTRALLDGRVVPDGIDLNYLPLEPEETFWRMIRHQEFDVSEMSLAMYAIECARSTSPFVAIPVFPSRMFRHSSLYVRQDSSIERPEDLIGKRVGVPEYQITAAVWVRGILKDQYGVSPEQIEWVTGGQEHPDRKEKIPLQPPPGVHVEQAPPGRSLNDMLLDGEIAALLAARTPSIFRTRSSQIRRLFRDCRQVEKEYFNQTGIFPIMHTIVVRRDVHQQYPWVASSILKAFIQAKRLCYQMISSPTSLRYLLPWMVADVEEMVNLMGEDPWPDGLSPNQKTLQTLMGYLWDQGLTPRRLDPEELFAPNTLESFKI